MVLVQSAQSPLFRVHPNPARIFGLAGALALNAAVLMALMLPMDLPMPKPIQDSLVVVDIPLLVKPPEKPPVVDVVKPPTETVPVVRQPVALPPVADPPILVDNATSIDVPYVPPVADAGPAVEPVIDTAPVAGVRLEYASAAPPPYPRDQMLSGTQGTVLLQVLVDVDGKPLKVTIHQSSGSKELDRAAQRHVLRSWTFRPATQDGRAIQAIGIVPIDFKLQ